MQTHLRKKSLMKRTSSNELSPLPKIAVSSGSPLWSFISTPELHTPEQVSTKEGFSWQETAIWKGGLRHALYDIPEESKSDTTEKGWIEKGRQYLALYPFPAEWQPSAQTGSQKGYLMKTRKPIKSGTRITVLACELTDICPLSLPERIHSLWLAWQIGSSGARTANILANFTAKANWSRFLVHAPTEEELALGYDVHTGTPVLTSNTRVEIIGGAVYLIAERDIRAQEIVCCSFAAPWCTYWSYINQCPLLRTDRGKPLLPAQYNFTGEFWHICWDLPRTALEEWCEKATVTVRRECYKPLDHAEWDIRRLSNASVMHTPKEFEKRLSNPDTGGFQCYIHSPYIGGYQLRVTIRPDDFYAQWGAILDQYTPADPNRKKGSKLPKEAYPVQHFTLRPSQCDIVRAAPHSPYTHKPAPPKRPR